MSLFLLSLKQAFKLQHCQASQKNIAFSFRSQVAGAKCTAHCTSKTSNRGRTCEIETVKNQWVQCSLCGAKLYNCDVTVSEQFFCCVTNVLWLNLQTLLQCVLPRNLILYVDHMSCMENIHHAACMKNIYLFASDFHHANIIYDILHNIIEKHMILHMISYMIFF